MKYFGIIEFVILLSVDNCFLEERERGKGSKQVKKRDWNIKPGR